VNLDFQSSCDIKHQQSHSLATTEAPCTTTIASPSPSSQTYLSTRLTTLAHPHSREANCSTTTANPQWRLATQVHAQATTAGHTQTAATTTQETHATPDHHAATAAILAIALPTPPAAAAEAAPTPPTEPPIATPDPLAHAHQPAPLTTTTLHVNALLRALLVVQMQPIRVSLASRM